MYTPIMSVSPPLERAQVLDYFHAEGRAILTAQTRALDAVIHDMSILDPDQQRLELRIPMLMLQAVGISVHSVLALTTTRGMAIRDCFGICRSAVETTVNAAFICVGGVDEANRSYRYMRQKRWRDLNREGTIADLRISTSRDIEQTVADFPGLQEALNEFSDPKGREKRSWTSLSIEQRIAAISEVSRRAAIAFGSAVFGIYRPASELLHGSYYGVNLFWQGSRDKAANTPEDFDQLWLAEHFATLLSCLFFV
ncbi:MAG: DUF5677 domain-containing protein [Sphingomonas fennica]